MAAYELIFVISLIGISETSYLLEKRRKGGEVVCLPNEECNKILTSKYNKTLGVYNDTLGLVFYVSVSVLAALVIIEVFPKVIWEGLLKDLVAVGALMSVRFVYIQYKIIKGKCLWCLFSAFNNFLMVLILIIQLLV